MNQLYTHTTPLSRPQVLFSQPSGRCLSGSPATTVHLTAAQPGSSPKDSIFTHSGSQPTLPSHGSPRIKRRPLDFTGPDRKQNQGRQRSMLAFTSTGKKDSHFPVRTCEQAWPDLGVPLAVSSLQLLRTWEGIKTQRQETKAMRKTICCHKRDSQPASLLPHVNQQRSHPQKSQGAMIGSVCSAFVAGGMGRRGVRGDSF